MDPTKFYVGWSAVASHLFLFAILIIAVPLLTIIAIKVALAIRAGLKDTPPPRRYASLESDEHPLRPYFDPNAISGDSPGNLTPIDRFQTCRDVAARKGGRKRRF